MKPMLKTLLLCAPLVACGGDGGSSKTDPDYSNLHKANIEPGPLRQASANELSALVKNGLRVSLHEHQSYGEMILHTTVVNAPADSKAGGNFSGTNVQVAGVDEADYVKYDGRYIYFVTPTEYTDTGPKASLKILATNPNSPSVNETSSTPLETKHWGDVAELYLVDSAQGTTGLATVRRSWDFMEFDERVTTDKSAITNDADKAISQDIWPYQMERGIEITLYDVRTPASPAKTWSLAIDGNLLGTRKIGNTLYLISSFVPGIPALNYAAETKEAKIANEELIAQTRIEKLLPEYSINGGTPIPLNTSNGCMIPANTKTNDGSLNLVNITAINLASQQLIESVCVNGNVAGIYSSVNHFYLGGSDSDNWENWHSYTVLHQFALNANGVDYSATGSVEGTLGWQSPSFRIDEHNNFLRVITTTFNDIGEPTHHLNILQKVSGRSELEVVAQLPNKARPEAIGKPREDIYGVRFNGNKAYVVTFERKDPFYVLDLANPTDPKIAGHLEIPGFSTYLHPVNDNYVFALGNEIKSNGLVGGIKVSLYDIRNPAKPLELSQHVLGTAYSWSHALYDHRALSFLQANSDQLRITFPVSLYEEVQFPEYTGSRWINDSLYQFEVNGLANGKVSLDLVDNLIGENNLEQQYPRWRGNDRGILHGDALFYVHGPKVIASPWKKAN